MLIWPGQHPQSTARIWYILPVSFKVQVESGKKGAHMGRLAEVLIIMPGLQALAQLHENAPVRAHLNGLVQACVCQPQVAAVVVHSHHVRHVEGLSAHGCLHRTCNSTPLVCTAVQQCQAVVAFALQLYEGRLQPWTILTSARRD